MSNGLIAIQAGAIEKKGVVHIPSHWSFIVGVYGKILPGTMLVCREDENLRTKQSLPIPDGLKPVLLKGVNAVGVIDKFIGYLHSGKKIKELVSDADFVATVLPSHLGSLFGKEAQKQGKPLFFEVAGENIQSDYRPSLKLPVQVASRFYTRYIDAKLTQYADVVVYVSQYLAERAGRAPLPLAVIPHTTIHEDDIFVREDTCNGNEIRIFSANRIVREKGLQNLLTVIRRLRDEGFNVTAILAGDGDYLAELKRQCLSLELEDAVTFPGHINVGPALWQFYRQADIMVLPSMAAYEGTPKCIIEAMASGCPVVASSVGGITIMLKESGCGVLVKPGDIDGLTQALEFVICNREYRKQYIASGLKWARQVTLEKRTERIKQLLQKCLPNLFSTA